MWKSIEKIHSLDYKKPFIRFWEYSEFVSGFLIFILSMAVIFITLSLNIIANNLHDEEEQWLLGNIQLHKFVSKHDLVVITRDIHLERQAYIYAKPLIQTETRSGEELGKEAEKVIHNDDDYAREVNAIEIIKSTEDHLLKIGEKIASLRKQETRHFTWLNIINQIILVIAFCGVAVNFIKIRMRKDER